MPTRRSPRFIVIGLHPSIDRTIDVDRIRVGGVIRGRLAMVEASGKGANIAHNLANFGHAVATTGFLGRWDAQFFLASFHPGRVRARFVIVPGATRQNITLIETELRRDTHITAGSLCVGRRDLAALVAKVDRLIRLGDPVVFSGSLPQGVEVADYVALLRLAARKGGRLCVDTSGPALRAALELRPWTLKPNRDELQELVGRPLRSFKQVLSAARDLTDRCENVLVSLGGEGALLATPDGAWRGWEAGPADVVHTVGCGDALFSGFLSARARGRTVADALRFAVACGSACVRSYYAQVRTRREATAWMDRIRVETVLPSPHA
jgi:1-phosphofructokinase